MSDASTIERLTREREKTLKEIERLRALLQEEIEPSSATDDDSADTAAAIYERSKVLSLIANLEERVHALEHALELAQEGRYGFCESCGKPIAPERLEIMPEATLCVHCASRQEEELRRRTIISSRRRRKIEIPEE